jgi:ABC-2 type transport system ATP-binding protein
MVPAIETDRLTKRYGAGRGIEELSMTVEPGEVFGFLGSNGAGKTTTIRTLLDLLHPTSGSARILGLDSRADSTAIRARIGNLAGDFACDPRLRGHDVLDFCARARGIRDLRRARALATRFEAELDRPVGDLSTGNRQKIGLIQALFHDPELLVLDEPTTGLDPLMREELLTLIEEERERGRTVFLSSHELDEVQRVCDRVGVIRAGRLISVEKVADLRRRTYRRVRIAFAEPVDAAEFAALPGVSGMEISAEDGALAFRVEGELDPVVKAAARHTVVDLEIEQPSLEEVFLAFYGHEEADR